LALLRPPNTRGWHLSFSWLRPGPAHQGDQACATGSVVAAALIRHIPLTGRSFGDHP